MTAGKQERAVRWSAAAAIVDLHPAWASSSRATDVNEDGWISGYAATQRNDTTAVLWSPDGVVVSLAGANSIAYGLNDLERAVGIDLNALSGGYGTYDGFAVLWPPLGFGAPTVLHPCGPGNPSVGRELSNLGRIVGWCGAPSGSGFVVNAWTTRTVGAYEWLPVVSGTSLTLAYAVNACGTVVGSAAADAMIWTRINTSGPSGAPVCDK
jgi:uncharacterized membrane protein